MRFILQDLAATIVAIMLVMGVVGLSAIDQNVPAELGPPLGAATTWLFIRGAATLQTLDPSNPSNGSSRKVEDPPRP